MHKAPLTVLNSALHLWLLSPAPCRSTSSSARLMNLTRRQVSATPTRSRASSVVALRKEHMGTDVNRPGSIATLNWGHSRDPEPLDSPADVPAKNPGNGTLSHIKRRLFAAETCNIKFRLAGTKATSVRAVQKSPPTNAGIKRAGIKKRCRKGHPINVSAVESIQNVEQAWATYQIETSQGLQTTTAEIHGLFHLLAIQKPQLRKNAIRMRCLIDELRRRKPGSAREWEWNSLILASGSGFRNTTARDYHGAVAVLKEWEEELAQHPARLQTARGSQARPQTSSPSSATYNILLSIATRSEDPDLIQDALARLHTFSSDHAVPFDRHAYLTLMAHYRLTNRVDHVFYSLERMLDRKMEIGTDGANATLWALVWNDRIEEAESLYSKIVNRQRHLVDSAQELPIPVPNLNLSEITPPSSLFAQFRGVVEVFERLDPNEKTFIILVQAYAYRGQLVRALSVLQDYLDFIVTTSAKWTQVPPTEPPEAHLLAAFRALFLGFVKHGQYRELQEKRTARKSTASAPMFSMETQGSIADGPSPLTPTSNDLEQPVHNPKTLLHIIRSYVILSSTLGSASNPANPPTLPPSSFVRTLLLAARNTVGDDVGFRRAVWSLLVRERLAPCGDAWGVARSSKAWRKMREEFKIYWSWDKNTDQ